jgi:hypothetical protein
MEMPVDQSERLHTAGHLVLLGRLTQILQERELEPEQLVRVAEALSRQRTAVVRAQAQRLAHRKWLQAARAAPKGRRSIFDDPEELNRRVRMIYGIDMPTSRSSAQLAARPVPRPAAPVFARWAGQPAAQIANTSLNRPLAPQSVWSCVAVAAFAVTGRQPPRQKKNAATAPPGEAVAA